MNPHTSDNLARDYESLYRNNVSLLRQVDHLSMVREIGLAVASTLDLDEMLKTIAEVVQGALEVRKLTIYQVDPQFDTAQAVIAKFGDDRIGKDRLQEEKLALRGTPAGDALLTRRVMLVQDAIRSEAYVPLVAKNSPVGLMRLEERRDAMPFTDDDAALYHSLGMQIGIALNNAQLYALAVTDGLTGLYVRRYFDLRMSEEFDQARRYRRCFSLMLFDIDHFKKFNDTHGHQTGDMVLQQFASLLQINTRRSDICCRYGGEEMVVVLPETRLKDAYILAEKLRDTISKHVFTGANKEELHVTSSIGVSEFRESMKDPADLVKAADDALYRAKDNGRNRVEKAL
jgi:diguanylate cyclase (GGDEF)-like protein